MKLIQIIKEASAVLLLFILLILSFILSGCGYHRTKETTYTVNSDTVYYNRERVNSDILGIVSKKTVGDTVKIIKILRK